jgi:hypothetical protein
MEWRSLYSSLIYKFMPNSKYRMRGFYLSYEAYNTSFILYLNLVLTLKFLTCEASAG